MYIEHFGLKEIPFSIAPDPRYLYMSDGHREALAHLLYGMNSDGGFVLLTGEVGTGKTTVCRRLLESVPQDAEIAFILNPKLTVSELLASVCDEFGVSYPEGNASIKVFVDRISAYLLGACESGKRAVLIIEEAQNLSPEVLEQLRLLTNLETDRRKLLQIILLGQPELREILGRPELRQLSQRITARYHLGPLSKKEAGGYISHRLGIAGCRAQLFPPDVIKRIFRLSSGVPRVINVICDRALLGAFVEGKSAVDGLVLKRAAREVLGERMRLGGAAAYGWVTGLVILIVLGALLGSLSLRFGKTPAESGKNETPLRARGQYDLDVWKSASDFFPLLSMESPYHRVAGERKRGFSELQYGRAEGSPAGRSHSATAAAERRRQRRTVPGAGDTENDAPAVTDASMKGTENVIHP